MEFFCEPPLAFCGGMKAIGLEESWVGAEIADKAGYENGPLLFGDARIEFGEGGGVVGAVVGGDIHSQEDDLGTGFAASPDDLTKVFLGVLQRLAAERVVAAQFDDENLGRSLEDPIDPGQTAGRGVAADPTVDDRDIETIGSKQRFSNRGEGLGFGETEARRQAVAEHDDTEFGGDLDGRNSGWSRGEGRRRRRFTAADEQRC